MDLTIPSRPGINIGGGSAAGGGSIFNKMKNVNEEDLKNKLKAGGTGFRGLPL